MSNRERLLAFTEHILNKSVVRDKFSNNVLPIQLSEFFTNFVHSLDMSSEPFLYDNVVCYADFFQKAFLNIVRNPRANIVKTDSKEYFYMLKQVDSKTLNWVAKQPGRNMRQKLGHQDKILSHRKLLTYDILENRAVAQVHKEIVGELKRRAPVMVDSLNKKLRESNLASVQPQKTARPNNVLLCDRNYGVVWKAGLKLKHYKKVRNIYLRDAPERWIHALLYLTAASLYKRAGFAMTDFIVVADDSNFFFEDCQTKEMVNKLELFLSTDDKEMCEFVSLEVCGDILSIEVSTKQRHQVLYKTEMSEKYRVRFVYNEDSNQFGYTVNENDTKYITADLEGLQAACTYIIEACLFIKLNDIEPETVIHPNPASFDFTSYATAIRTTRFSYTQSYGVKMLQNVYKPQKKCFYINHAVCKTLRDALFAEQEEDVVYAEKIIKAIETDKSLPFIYMMPDSAFDFSQAAMRRYFKSQYANAFPVWRSVAAFSQLVVSQKFAERQENKPGYSREFLVIDCYDDELTATKVKFAESKKIIHYPPVLLDVEESDISMYTYMNRYMELFSDIYQLRLEDTHKQFLIRSGDLECAITKRVLVDIKIDDKIFCLFYDENIEKTLWNSYYKQALEAVLGYIYEQKREGNTYFEQISGMIICNKFIDDDRLKGCLKDYFKEYKKNNPNALIKKLVSNVYGNDDITNGANKFINQVGKNEIMWYEYLPSLALKIIKEGRYGKLNLTPKGPIANMFGTSEKIDVPDTLVLSAGHKEYRFPLQIGTGGRNKQEFNAYIKDKSFPLKHDVTVKLMLTYKYGDVDSYDLKIKAVGGNADFQTIDVVWDKTVASNKDIEDIAPNISINEKKIAEAIQYFEDFTNIHMSKLTNWMRFGRLKDNVFFSIYKELYRNTQTFLADDKNHRLKAYLPIKDVVSLLGRVKDYSETYFDKKIVDDIAFKIIRYCISLGTYIDQDYKHRIIENMSRIIEKLDKDPLSDGSDLLACALCFDTDNAFIMDKVLERLKDPSESVMTEMMYQLKEPMKHDKKILQTIYYSDKQIIERMIKVIRRKFMSFSDQGAGKIVVYAQILLCMLELRELEGFDLLKTGSKICRELANYIVKFDGEKNINFRTSYGLSQESKAGLYNMGDLPFLLNSYLTGEFSANIPSMLESDI